LVSISGDDCQLGIDTAIPCGLLIHELVSNAFKHAFSNHEAGVIEISLRHTDGTWVLTVHDDGIGIPKSIDPFNTKSLGLQLVTTLTRQLDGKPSFKTGPGTTFTLAFTPEQTSPSSSSRT
jgi:two-component sensor histidine kinase